MVCQHYRRCLYLSRPSTVGMRLVAALLVTLTLGGAAHGADELVRYRIIDGTIPEPLTAQAGNPDRGRRIVLDRDAGDCTVCHAMPLPQREFHGTVGPPLDGIGRRATFIRPSSTETRALHVVAVSSCASAADPAVTRSRRKRCNDEPRSPPPARSR